MRPLSNHAAAQMVSCRLWPFASNCEGSVLFANRLAHDHGLIEVLNRPNQIHLFRRENDGVAVTLHEVHFR